MKTLYLDLETYNVQSIAVGAYRYAETAEILLAAYAWDDAPAEVLDFTDGATLAELELLVLMAEQIVMHNSGFDRVVLAAQGIHIPTNKITDTMALALAHSLPASLGELGQVLGLSEDKAKDKDGKKLINLFSKERPKKHKLRRATRDTHPEEWGRFVEYARMDVVATRYVLRGLPTWNDSLSERRIWQLDQTINDRGIAVDVGLARSAIRAFQRSAGHLAARSRELTGGAVPSLTQRDKLMQHLSDAYGFNAPDMTKSTVAGLLESDLEPEVRELLEIRQQASVTSPAKYKRLLQAVSSDDRLRGTLAYCGASRTGRWGGRIFQPQNLPRATMKQAEIDMGIEAMLADAEDILVDNVAELCSNAVRGVLVASEGHKLIVSDLSGIEGRVLAWIAGEEWKLKAFRDYDRGHGFDTYINAYSKSFNVPPEEVLHNYEHGDKSMRQIGKVQELALGYQGSVGAFVKMAAIYGVSLPEEEVLEIVKAWRKAHPAVKSFWYDIEKACKEAIWSPGDGFRVRDISILSSDDWLRIRLPSGRYLCYPDARVEEGKILYEGKDQYTRKWTTLDTYGGKLTENIVQAVARDVLAEGLLLAEAKGYLPCLHIHDEIIAEVPDAPEWTVEGLSAIMATNPAWSLGLPLAAAGFETKRYRKE